MQKDYSDKEILLTAIYQKDNEAYKYMRRMYFRMAETIVTCNGGSEDDAEDIFSEGMYVLVEKAHKGILNSSAKFSSYLYVIWYKMWMKELRDRDSNERNAVNMIPAREWSPEEALDRTVYEKIAWKCYSDLKKDCQKIIKYIRDEMKYVEIARLMKTTTGFIKKRSHECKAHWLKLIKSHPGYLKAVGLDKNALE